jgi:hypothetical protein
MNEKGSGGLTSHIFHCGGGGGDDKAMISPLPYFFGQKFRKTEVLAWKPNIIISARGKWCVLIQMTIDKYFTHFPVTHNVCPHLSKLAHSFLVSPKV